MGVIVRDNINTGFINSKMQPCPRNLKSGGAVPFVNTYSMNFDGIDDYIDCGSSTDLNPTTAYTISAWVKRSYIILTFQLGDRSNQM